MQVSLNWLSQYVDISGYSSEELAEKITKTGIEVDGIETIAEKNAHIVVGHVQTCQQHPSADKLKVCQVDVGTEKLQIVCGASNVRQGQKVAVAKPGAVLPDGTTIKKANLRDIESNGMICSMQELGMENKYIPKEFANGIFVFPDDVQIGEPVDQLLNLDDTILEFDLTPNRSDCLSMLGVAYEVAAILDRPITLPEETVKTSSDDAQGQISISSEDPDLNPYYAAFVIKDAVIKTSPLWIRNALMASGIRPINNVVDITNFVLMEYGQPLHAFDFDSLATDHIVVRPALDHETLETLDGELRTLSRDNLVITDGKKPVALAGVMGGTATEVHEGTQNILLEAAYFDPLTIRKTVNETGLRSESSTRFEKGVDPQRVYRAGLRACRLLQQYADARILSGAALDDNMKVEPVMIPFRMDTVNQRLGTSIGMEEAAHILERLQFPYEMDGARFHVSIPSRRDDVRIFEDMLEEIARIHGYDNLPYTLPITQTQPGGLTSSQTLKRDIKRFMESVGLMETITHSLTDETSVKRLLSPDLLDKRVKPVRLAMPMTTDHEYLRLSMLPELMHVFSYNMARQQSDIAYYELGRVFLPQDTGSSKQPIEQERLSGALTGMWLNHPWQKDNKTVDFYLVKGILQKLFSFLNMSVSFKQGTLTDMHPGRCAFVVYEEETIGFLGQVHPKLAKDMDLKDTYVFDLNMDKIKRSYIHPLTYNSIPKYPSIVRDVAFVLDQPVQAEDVRKNIAAAGGPLLKDVYVFDLYDGEHLPTGKKSIAYHLIYQHPDKTLKDAEVEDSFQQVINAVNETYDAYVRK